MTKKIIRVIFIFFFLTISIYFYLKNNNKNENENITKLPEKEITYNSNILKNVNYTSKDKKGNEYIIEALMGEIDFSNNNIIFLTNVTALIKLENTKSIKIISDFGKYNTINNDTIFSKNVKVNYLENKITGEYLDFSIKRNSMIMSRNVVYTNLENILKADVVEVDIKTKDTKIFMYETDKKVKVKNID